MKQRGTRDVVEHVAVFALCSLATAVIGWFSKKFLDFDSKEEDHVHIHLHHDGPQSDSEPDFIDQEDYEDRLARGK